MTRIWTITAACLALLTSPAFAHGGDHPLHGGQVVVVGETAFELVAKPAGAELYVIEDGDPVNAAAMSAKLSVSGAAGKQDIAMVPAGGNRFTAPGAKLPKGAKVGVLLIDKQSQARQSAMFTLK